MKRKAFTLIEILVVVFIFWVGILAVLQLLTRSLGYFDAITMKTKATLLAKEGIEIAYGFRDSNIEQGYPWNFLSFDESSEVNEKPFLTSDSKEEKLTEILNLVKKKKLLKKILKHSTLNSTQEIAKILLLTITIFHKMNYQAKDLQGFLSLLP